MFRERMGDAGKSGIAVSRTAKKGYRMLCCGGSLQAPSDERPLAACFERMTRQRSLHFLALPDGKRNATIVLDPDRASRMYLRFAGFRCVAVPGLLRLLAVRQPAPRLRACTFPRSAISA
jgi:hypothetical protein